MPSEHQRNERLERVAIWATIIGTVVAVLTFLGLGPLSNIFGSGGAGSISSGAAPGGSSPALALTPPQSAVSTPASTSPSPRPAMVVTGKWSQENGQLILTITEVDLNDGLLLLHMKVVNNSAAAMELPLYGYFVVTDNTGKTYAGSDGTWTTSVPSGGFVTGIVTLNPAPPAAARRLDVSFTTVFGQYAPPGGITIHAVPVPH
jgi:hypothetical protein